MPLKDTVVHVDASEDNVGYLDAVTAIAAQHGSLLRGLHVVDIPAYPADILRTAREQLLRAQRQHYLVDAGRAKQRFEAVCRRHEVAGEWHCVEGTVATTIASFARSADLLVLRTPTAEGLPRDRFDLVEEVMVNSGRSVLVIPGEWSGADPGVHITIGWDGSNVAARAVGDALPLLCKANRVSVVAVAQDGPAGLGPPASDIVAHLTRHGVGTTEEVLESSGISIGEALLQWTRQTGSNLLVIGAYGHSRLSEVLLGGVTRHVLANAPHPVLYSH